MLSIFYIGGFAATIFQRFEATKYKKIFCYLSLFFLLTAPLFSYATKIYEYRCFPIIFLILYTPTLLYFSAHRLTTPVAVQKIIEAAGNMTYSSYLIHFPIQILIALYFSSVKRKIPYYDKTFFIFFMAITLIVAYYIYKFFELPAQNYIREKTGIVNHASSAAGRLSESTTMPG